MARKLEKLPDYFAREEASTLVAAAPSYQVRMAMRIKFRTGQQGETGLRGAGARQVFRDNLRSVGRFQEHESRIKPCQIDPGIVKRFRDAVVGHGWPLHREFIRVRDRIATRRDQESTEQRRRFIAKLRQILAHACLDVLEPDLVILDDFQRFRDLMDAET